MLRSQTLPVEGDTEKKVMRLNKDGLNFSTGKQPNLKSASYPCCTKGKHVWNVKKPFSA